MNVLQERVGSTVKVTPHVAAVLFVVIFGLYISFVIEVFRLSLIHVISVLLYLSACNSPLF